MVMRFSDMVRQSVRANPSLNNGTIPGGLAYALESGLEGWELGKDKRSRKEAMEAAALALGGLAGFGQPSTAPAQGAQAASVTPPPATFQPFSQQVHASVRDRGPAFSQPSADASFPPAQTDPSSDRMLQAIIHQESRGNPDAVSPVGARGIMQVMPATAMQPGYGMESIFDYAAKRGIDTGSDRSEQMAKSLLMNAELNKAFGADYFNKMKEQYGGSDVLALAAYNAGGGNVNQWIKSIGDPRKGQVTEQEFVSRIPFKETKDYVTKITGSLSQPVASQAPAQVPAAAAATPMTQPAPQPQAAPLPQAGGQEAIGQLVALAQAGNPYALEALQGVMSLQQGRADKADARSMQEREWQFRQQQAAQEQAYRQQQMGMQQERFAFDQQRAAAEAAAPQGVDFGSSVDGRALAVVTEIEAKRRQGKPNTPQEEVMFQAASAHLAQPKFTVDQASGRVIQTGGLNTGAMFGSGQPGPSQPGSAPGSVAVAELPLSRKEQQAAEFTKSKEAAYGDAFGRAMGRLESGSASGGPLGGIKSLFPGEQKAQQQDYDIMTQQVVAKIMATVPGIQTEGDALRAMQQLGTLSAWDPVDRQRTVLKNFERFLGGGALNPTAGQAQAAPAQQAPAAVGGLSPEEDAVMRRYLPAGSSTGGW